ncbi:terpene synthase family protein [Streptomyces toxytricini]|uniref:terpene synthase family protein n=1 Tax=Streptomyces toxytricini TaxID=67369 RepID=UPI0034462D1A
MTFAERADMTEQPGNNNIPIDDPLVGSSPVTVDLPPLYCPIAPVEHRRTEQFLDRGIGWMRRFGFCSDEEQRAHALRTDSHDWFPRMVPDASDERLQILVDWCYLMYVFDDVYCDDGPTSRDVGKLVDFTSRLLRAMEAPETGPMPGDSPFAAPIRDLMLRARACTSPTVIRRWTQAQRAWMYGCAWQTSFRAGPQVLTLNDYASMRPLVGCSSATLTAIELATGEVPSEEINAAPVQALIEAAALTSIWDNDLFSYGRETWLAQQTSHAPTTPDNLIDLLSHERRLSLHDAIAEAVSLRNRCMYFFVQLRNQLAPTAGPELRRYLDSLGNVIRRNLDAGLTMDRYTNPDGRHPNAVAVTATLIDECPVQDRAALELPTTSWWWKHLRTKRADEGLLDDRP